MPPSPSSSTHSSAVNADAKSAAASPTTTMTSTHSEPDHTTATNSLDDIFGSSPADHHQQHISIEHDSLNQTQPNYDDILQSTSTAEPSDLPSLRRQHVTAGYRDGIAQSKSEHVQRGFDGGYPVGAQFGLRVGTILGILEGVVGGLESSMGQSGPVKKQSQRLRNISGSDKDDVGEESAESQGQRQKVEMVRQLYKNALKELDVQALFGGLKADAEQEGNENEPDFTEETKPENRLRQKADPAVARWERLVDVTRWEESMEAVESMEDQGEANAERE